MRGGVGCPISSRCQSHHQKQNLCSCQCFIPMTQVVHLYIAHGIAFEEKNKDIHVSDGR